MDKHLQSLSAYCSNLLVHLSPLQLCCFTSKIQSHKCCRFKPFPPILNIGCQTLLKHLLVCLPQAGNVSHKICRFGHLALLLGGHLEAICGLATSPETVELQIPWFLDVSWFIVNFAVQGAIKLGICIPCFEDTPE